MKKLIILILLLKVSATSFSQQSKPLPKLTKTGYLQKSKHQNKIAWICVSGGTALVLTGMVVAPKDYNVWYDVNTPKEDRQYHLAEALALTGFTSMIVSIPLFIASHRNKKKGKSLSFKNETVPQLQRSNFVSRSVPSLSLAIRL